MNDFEQKKLRAEELRKELNHHIYRYYVENENDISDYEYDMLMRELDSIEKEYPELLAPDSPTHRVGGQADGLFETVVHTVKMESLQDAFQNTTIHILLYVLMINLTILSHFQEESTLHPLIVDLCTKHWIVMPLEITKK